MLTCTICNIQITSFKRLAKHKDQHNQSTYQCEHCKFTTGVYRYFIDHVNEHRKKSNFDPKCAHCGFSSFNLQLVDHHKRKRNCKKCSNNGFDTSFDCIKQYNAHTKDCRGQGLEDKDVNVVDVDVAILKEEFQPETTDHSEDMPVLEERTVDQFQSGRTEAKRPEVRRIDVRRPDSSGSVDDKPLPKRRRIACLNTFAISTV